MPQEAGDVPALERPTVRAAQPTLEAPRPLASMPAERSTLHYGSSASRLY
jgi:hypothetical protein